MKYLHDKITCDMIREHSPCYDPSKFADCEKDSKTLIEILEMENVPAKDRVWVATEFLDDKTNRLFAVWCAREALKLVEKPDPRSITACDVAERFANGEATKEELSAAEYAAAAWSAESAAAAESAARSAAAAESARSAAWSAAESAAWSAQIKQLLKMLGDSTEEGLLNAKKQL